MKFFIVFASALAAASAGLISPIATVIAGPQHLPVIGPNGVPIDTPAVQQARAAHLSQKAEAYARNGDLSLVAGQVGVVGPIAAPIAAGPAILASVSPAAYPTTLGVPVVTGNGVPLETPEVVAAKSNHFAAHAEALARNSPIYAPAGPIISGQIASIAAAPALVSSAVPAAYPTTLGLPVVTANGVPLETPEVVAAKSNHFAAYAETLARNSPIYAPSASYLSAPIATAW